MIRASSLSGMMLLSILVTDVQAQGKRPQPPPQLCIGTSCADSSVVPVKAGPIKWNPGHYMASNSVIFAGQSISRIQGEMDQLSGWENIQGYRVFTTWGALEPQENHYDFSTTDAIMARLKTKYGKPRHMVLVVLPGTFANSLGSNNTSTLPGYLQSSSEMGASPVSGSYGWWGKNSGGKSTGTYVAALYRPKVMDRFIALLQAIGAHYDSEPYFEGLMIQEDSWYLTAWSGAPDYSEASFVAQLKRMLLAAVEALPHTNVIMENTWLTTAGPTIELEQWMIANRIAPGTADAFGQSHFQGASGLGGLAWGLQSYAGVSSSGNRPSDQRAIARAMVDIEAPDICGGRTISGGPYSPMDIVNALNTTYQASHAFWTHLFGSESNCGPSTKWSSLAQTLSSNPLTHTDYPSSYPR